MKTAEALALGARSLPRRAGIPDPAREARWLLARAWGLDETRLRLEPDAEVPAVVLERYRDWLRRRADGVPAHHLTGRCEFWGRELLVSPAVLIPRPETELVVAAALELGPAGPARVLDVGTGSGCLAVTLALERPAWEVIAVDVSAAALAVARRNAVRLEAAVRLVRGDLGAALAGGFGLIVANLPYIPSSAVSRLPVEVRHDPVLALDGGGDGLRLLTRLAADLPRLLASTGRAVLELGEEQAGPVAELAARNGLDVVGRVRDLGGCERVLVLERGGRGS